MRHFWYCLKGLLKCFWWPFRLLKSVKYSQSSGSNKVCNRNSLFLPLSYIALTSWLTQTSGMAVLQLSLSLEPTNFSKVMYTTWSTLSNIWPSFLSKETLDIITETPFFNSTNLESPSSHSSLPFLN